MYDAGGFNDRSSQIFETLNKCSNSVPKCNWTCMETTAVRLECYFQTLKLKTNQLQNTRQCGTCETSTPPHRVTTHIHQQHTHTLASASVLPLRAPIRRKCFAFFTVSPRSRASPRLNNAAVHRHQQTRRRTTRAPSLALSPHCAGRHRRPPMPPLST